ncbi:MAG: glycosyltransferase, partial [Bacteroidales bacterium]
MKISIITCTYNSATTIADTIRSVNRQTYQDIEHIIVDGLSNDNTLEIVKANTTYRQHIISEKDNGIYDAFNKGIRAATGDIVGVLNSDDFYTEYIFLCCFAATFNDSDIDSVYGDIHFVSPDNLHHPVRYYSSASFRPWKMRMGFMFAHPSFYVKKS